MKALATTLAAFVFAATASAAQEPLLRTDLDQDPVLAKLISEALEQRPELNASRARLAAERAAVPQAGAWPDPMLSFGIQNDGFERLEIGTMETSYYAIMLSQSLPFPGKAGLRRDVAALLAQAAESDVTRLTLSTTAEIERGYVALLLVRGNLDLLARLEALWAQAEQVTKARYEVGQGSQADYLRAQLERLRLRQQRLSREAAAQTTVQALNRLRGRPLDEPIVTVRRMEEISDPSLPGVEEAWRDAEARSPELAAARFATAGATAAATLARRDLLPDLAFGAGIMPRGDLPPMWQVTLGITLPVYAGSKQLRAIDEASARRSEQGASEEAVRQILAQRTRERLALLGSAIATNAIYRGGLLVQSEATVGSTVAQYQVGKVPFTAVLEAFNGYFADRSGFLASLASALDLAIAQRELSLEPSAGLPAGLAGGSAGMSTGMPEAGGTTRRGTSAAPGTSGGGQPMGSM